LRRPGRVFFFCAHNPFPFFQVRGGVGPIPFSPPPPLRSQASRKVAFSFSELPFPPAFSFHGHRVPFLSDSRSSRDGTFFSPAFFFPARFLLPGDRASTCPFFGNTNPFFFSPSQHQGAPVWVFFLFFPSPFSKPVFTDMLFLWSRDPFFCFSGGFLLYVKHHAFFHRSPPFRQLSKPIFLRGLFLFPSSPPSLFGAEAALPFLGPLFIVGSLFFPPLFSQKISASNFRPSTSFLSPFFAVLGGFAGLFFFSPYPARAAGCIFSFLRFA